MPGTIHSKSIQTRLSLSLCRLCFSIRYAKRKTSPSLSPSPLLPETRAYNLHILAHHSNHQIEKTNSLDESETENGIGEKLATHGWVAGNSHDERREHHADTDTSAAETDGRGSHTHVLRDLDHGGGDFGGEGSGLAGLSGLEDLRDLSALGGLEGGGLAGSGLGDACDICVR